MKSINWIVELTKSSEKQRDKLPEKIRQSFNFLTKELAVKGPAQPSWKNFSKFRGRIDDYHCHLKSGKPTYVVCWKVTNKNFKIIEVYYVGTHENAPY